jgi:HrpA-like RNA helicase
LIALYLFIALYIGMATIQKPGKIKIHPEWMTDEDIQKVQTMPAIDYISEWFKKRIPAVRGGTPIIKPSSPRDRIMLLESGTGSGKSTTLGPELYLRFFPATQKNIAVTQPRVLTATGIPLDIVGIYKKLKMGVNIGYQTGSYTLKPPKGIVFMTDGVLAQQLKVMSDDEFMEKYAFIVIDECHNRTMAIDLIFSLLKRLIMKNYSNKECPFVIFTSATFNIKKYADYFGLGEKNIIEVAGLNYPVTPHFLEVPSNNFMETAAKIALDIHYKNTADYVETNRFTDILIFVHGTKPASEIQKIINTEVKNNTSDNYFVLIMLNSMSFSSGDDNYQNIFKPLYSIESKHPNGSIIIPLRRIIISTNIAETGVTIDTLKYVIDTGFENNAVFNPVYGSSSVIPQSVTRGSAVQRRGRVGRRAPGDWYPVYTKETFETMRADAHPNILTTDICDTMLGLIIKTVYPSYSTISDELVQEGVFNPFELDMLDDPPIDALGFSIEKLFVLGMITCDFEPTIIGLMTNSVSKMAMECTRMMLAGYQYDANIPDLITMAAFITVGSKEYKDSKSKKKYSYASVFDKNANVLDAYNKLFIADDFIESVFIWNDFLIQIELMKNNVSFGHMKTWAESVGLSYQGLLYVVAKRDEIVETFIQKLGVDPFYNGLGLQNYNLSEILKKDIQLGVSEITKLKKCIYEGYRLNMASYNTEKKTYIIDAINMPVSVSSNVVKQIPEYSTFQQTKPKKIIIGSISLSENSVTGLYQFSSNTASVMDGFVDIDDTFLTS